MHLQLNRSKLVYRYIDNRCRCDFVYFLVIRFSDGCVVFLRIEMTSKGIENVNPQRFTKKTKREITSEEEDESVEDPIDEREIFGKVEVSIKRICVVFFF